MKNWYKRLEPLENGDSISVYHTKEVRELEANYIEAIEALRKIRNHRIDYDIVHPFIDEVLEKLTGQTWEDLKNMEV